jgi:hypothetical protein
LVGGMRPVVGMVQNSPCDFSAWQPARCGEVPKGVRDLPRIRRQSARLC